MIEMQPALDALAKTVSSEADDADEIRVIPGEEHFWVIGRHRDYMAISEIEIASGEVSHVCLEGTQPLIALRDMIDAALKAAAKP